MKPSIKKGIIITSVCAFTLVGIKFYLSLSNTVEVHSVSSLNTGYWDNPATSTGLVSNSDTQSVLYDSSKTITQVFVKEGQQVSVGDPLLSYDLTTLQSAVDTSQLEVEKAQNAITLAEHELKKLLNTTPVPDVVEKPEIQDPTPAPLPSVPTKNGNGLYPYILSLSQAEKNFTDYKIYYTNTESEAPEKGPKEDVNAWKEERIKKTSDNTSIYFKDKYIWQCGDYYTKHQGQYPVIFLSFKDVKCSSWQETFQKISKLISLEFMRHDELESSFVLSSYEKEQYHRFASENINEVDCQMGLQLLSLLLHKHYNKECVIIVDEYDTPIQQGHLCDFYNEIVDFMRNFFSGGSKKGII